MPQTQARPATTDALDGRARAALLDAVTQLAEERQRFAELEEAAQRAQEQSWAAPHRVQEAEAALAKARSEENSRIAYEFITTGLSTESPVSTAQAELEAARAADQQITRVRDAIAHELESVGARVRRREAAVHEALADVVVDSAAFTQLLAQHVEAWRRLRSIKVVMRTIAQACSGFAPQSLFDKIDAAEPLDIRVGYGVDEDFVGAWVDSLAALLEDPDHELPS